MKEKEWRGFAVQSVVLLVIVLALSVFHPGNIISENGTKVMADGATEDKKKVKKKEALQEYEGPVRTDEAHIKARSSTYIKIPKTVVPTGASIYLTDNYMKRGIKLVIGGTAGKKLKKEDIARYNNGSKFTGSTSKKNKKDIVENISTRYYLTKKKKYRTVFDFKTRHLYVPVLYETDTGYFISLARPRDVYDRIIVLDAGHGGIDEGTSSAKGHHEKGG